MRTFRRRLKTKNVCVRFLLEAYLWYQGEEYLRLAEEWIEDDLLFEHKYLTVMVVCARGLQIMQMYQNQLNREFEEHDFRAKLHFVGQNSGLKPDGPKDVLVFAEVIRRLARFYRGDPRSMDQAELRCLGL